MNHRCSYGEHEGVAGSTTYGFRFYVISPASISAPIPSKNQSQSAYPPVASLPSPRPLRGRPVGPVGPQQMPAIAVSLVTPSGSEKLSLLAPKNLIGRWVLFPSTHRHPSRLDGGRSGCRLWAGSGRACPSTPVHDLCPRCPAGHRPRARPASRVRVLTVNLPAKASRHDRHRERINGLASASIGEAANDFAAGKV